MRFKKWLVLNSVMLTLAVGMSAWGQSQPLEEKQKAVVLFDLRMDRLAESPLGKSMGIKEQIAQNAGGDIDASKLVRVFGMSSAPETIQELQEMQGGTVSVEFAVRLQFSDESSAKAAIDKMIESSSETFARNGRTYYRPSDEDAPENVVASQLDPTTLEMGTETFLFLADQKQAFSQGLQTAWGKINTTDDTIRIAIDLEGARGLIDEAIASAAGQADPMTQGFLDLVPGINDMTMTMDLSGGNLLGMTMGCKTSETATDLGDALNSIFGIAKMAGGSALNEMKAQDPKMADVGQKLLRSLASKVAQNEVQVAIPKPEGLEEAVMGAMQNFGFGAPGLNDGDF